MERQLLIVLMLSIFITGCQQVQIDPTSEIKNIQNKKIDSENNEILYETSYQEIWQYLKENNSNKEQVLLNEQVLSYMNMHLEDLESFKEYLNDSYYFIYFVIMELEKSNLPLELSLIPYIESNYDPFSISSSGAVGLWQFMPRTGRLYKLNKSWWSEDRHDPFKSTEAAVSYLSYLYERFNQDVFLTLAAYNAGPKRVKYWKKINKDPQKKQIDYVDWIELIKFKETRNYVQRVLENYNVYRYILEQKPIQMKDFFKNNPLF